MCLVTRSSLTCTLGGRHKKEVLVEGQSQLLLIREECGPPDAQVRAVHSTVLGNLSHAVFSFSSSKSLPMLLEFFLGFQLVIFGPLITYS